MSIEPLRRSLAPSVNAAATATGCALVTVLGSLDGGEDDPSDSVISHENKQTSLLNLDPSVETAPAPSTLDMDNTSTSIKTAAASADSSAFLSSAEANLTLSPGFRRTHFPGIRGNSVDDANIQRTTPAINEAHGEECQEARV